MAWAIKCIIIGLFTQAHGFSTTAVEEGEDARIECGLQTKAAEGYLKWEAITNDTTEVLAYDIRDGFSNCNDRIINCTIHANGSIHLESVSMEDGARHYRCLRGDDDGYNYYSDHRLLVLSKVALEKTSSPPSIETPHRDSVSSYNIDKKGVLHGYYAPVCEDDVDGILPVVCYPPSGIIVDREYETIQCNCTDSDGQVDSVTFPVTSITHWVHCGWRKASISLLVVILILISIIVVVIWICLNLFKILKTSNTNREHAAEDLEEMTHIQSGTKDKQISDLKDKIAALEGTLNNRQTELKEREEEVRPLTEQLEQKEKQETMKNKLEEQHKKISKRSTQRESQVMCLEGLQELQEMCKKMLETEMKNILEEQNQKGMKIAKEMTVTGLKNRDLNKLLEEKQDQPQKIRDWDQAACEHQCNEQPQGIL